MTEIKRYKVVASINDIECTFPKMFGSPDGEWVRWEDVQELLREIKRLEKKLEEETMTVDEAFYEASKQRGW